MGSTSGFLLNESKKIDINLLLKNHLGKFKLEEILRKDAFITIIATSKENINYEKLNIYPESPLVFKLLPIEKNNYLKYSQDFNDIQKNFSNLKSTPNILPLLQIEKLEDLNIGIVMRQYIKYNLNDIQYYLHCISEIEKKWICFQLLQALNQIHSKYKCHGDIKPNNILISSKLSVFLSDISVFKPVNIPIDDLHSYNTIFYSNEHDKSCYIAPERFINSKEIKNIKQNQLTTEMDIFSLGVVMSEIFLEKFSIFTQTDIINYKNRIIDIKNKLDEIKDIKIKFILQNMIELNPKKRKQLKELIYEFGTNLCPSPITKFIAPLNLMIIGYGYYKNDLLVGLLYKHFQQIWKCLCINNNNLKKLKIPVLKKKLNRNIILSLLNNQNTIYKVGNEFPIAFIPNEKKELFVESEINEDYFVNNNIYDDDSNNDCSILIVKYLLSCLENIKYISTYSVIFEMLFNLSKILIKNENSVIILDIIIPYYINLLKSKNSKLIIEVYNALIDLLFLIDYDNFFLNKIDYNFFNYYIFKNIYELYFYCNKLEIQCSIISRLDDIIELENNFLYSYLNTINYITSNKENKINKNLYNSIALYQSLMLNKSNNDNNDDNKKNKELSNNINFNDIYKTYYDDLIEFKKKLKNIIENIMINNDKDKDCLKLLVIQKYKKICMFLGNYNENILLFNYLFTLFNQNNYFIQKEIFKIFPSLIILFGKNLYVDYFLPFVERACQKKNSELMIIEIIDAIFLLTKMNLINKEDDYSRIYKILIPYFVHPNYLLCYKLNLLFNYIIIDEKNYITEQKNYKSKLYISLYHNIKNILLKYKQKNNENKKLTLSIINIIKKDLIGSIKDYYSIPREIFHLYKYNIESNLFKVNYSYLEPLLQNITKVKKDHFYNKIQKNDISQINLGLITKKEIDNIEKIKKSLYDVIIKDIKKILYNSNDEKYKNLDFVKTGFINKLKQLFNELNKKEINKNNFIEKWAFICCNQANIDYSNIFFLFKVLNIELTMNNLNYNNTYKDFMLVSGIKFKSININRNINNNYLKNTEIKGRFNYKLILNETDSIIQLIPVNNNIHKNIYQNMFISITEEGMIRLHTIYNEANFDDIYILKNRAQFKIDCDNYTLKKNNISYVEEANKIIIIIAIKKKLYLVTFDLNEDTNKKKVNDLEISYVVNYIDCISEKEIIAIENIYNNTKNYLTLGNIDNTISFYNYIENKIDYINNCASFSSSYGNIELIKTLSISNNILVTTSYGFIVLYDYELRLFTYVYSFSIKRKIKQIIEYIPRDYKEIIFEQFDNKKQVIEKEFIFIFLLTDDNEITLWNLSLLKPNIICKFIRTNNNIEDYKNQKDLNKEIIKVSKLFLEKNPKNEKYLNSIKNDFSIINIKEDEIIKMEIPFNYFEDDYSLPIMFIGDNSGNIRIFRFSYDILKKINKKEGHKIKNNKYSQIIISNENDNIEIRNDSKYIKNEGTFINYNIFKIKKNENENNNCEIEEMNDLLFMKDFEKNFSYALSCYSNGVIKLWTL